MYDTYSCGEAKRDHLVCQVYQQYHEILTLNAIGLCKRFQFDRDFSQDLLQDFYMRILARPDQVQEGLDKRGIAYLLQILKHLCIDQKRQRKSIKRIKIVFEHNPPRIVDYQHLCAAIYTEAFFENMQKLLGEADFKLMRLYISGYSYKEIAVELDSLESTIGVRIHRVKKVLQDYFRR